MSDASLILGFGAIAIDDIIYVDRPLNAEKGRVTDRLTDFGGNVATALVAATRLGAQTSFIGWLPKNPQTDPSSAELERHGVQTNNAPRHPDASAIRSTITVGSDGDRFIAYDDDVLHGTDSNLPDVILKDARALIIDAYATHSIDVVARARNLGLNVVADIEWRAPAGTDTLIALADHLVLPIAFARRWTGEVAPAALLRALWSDDRAAVILTDGENGTFVRQAGDMQFWHIPAYSVSTVDTTGAGDCFHGAYAAALVRGDAPLECARYASAAAAVSVSGQGGRKALPRHANCLSLIAEQPSVTIPVS